MEKCGILAQNNLMEIFYYNNNNKKNISSLESTRITFYELTFVLKGKMIYYVNGKKIELHAGDALFLQPQQTRKRNQISNSHYISYNYFGEDSDEVYNLPVHMPNVMSSALVMLLNAGNELHIESFHDLDALKPILSCLLQCLSYYNQKEISNPIVKQIKQYIQEHINEQITLKEVAQSLFFSTVYCSAIFKKETGISIIDYCLNEKIKSAKRLIMENVELQEIAKQLGFNSYNYFSRTFKLREGITPTQYKQKFSFLTI